MDAPLPPARATFLPAILAKISDSCDQFLLAERNQLPLWFVVAFGAGIAGWFALGTPRAWVGLLVVAIAAMIGGLAIRGRASGRAMLWGGAALAAGLSLIWWRADYVAKPRLGRPQVVIFEGRVTAAEPRAAKDDVRLTLQTLSPGLPPLVRTTVAADQWTPAMGLDAKIRVRARLQPPPPMALPGTHDYSRDLWFQGIGAVGKAIGPPDLLEPSREDGIDAVRQRLGAHIRTSLPGSAGGIATALAIGDQAAVGEEDADAMRRSGLTHLLSVSGLHIAAVVGAAMLVSRRLFALSRRLATRFNVIILSAVVGAVAGIGYTILTGMQVPTVRSCIATLLVLAAIAMGREAISLRLVAVGALTVLIFRPEALAGASFQFSFAAVTAIIVLHQSRFARSFLMPREEGILRRFGRGAAGLIATGLAVEFALVPFALYHFHKAGLYGVAANLIAIPLTTFVVMPLEVTALLLDMVGLGAPLWAATGWSIDLILHIAHKVGNAKGAVAMLPSMPTWAFGLMVVGGLWMALWQGKWRWCGAVPVAAGAVAAILQPVPDLLITGDGQHVAVMGRDGRPALLRSRAGDFVRDMMTESAGYDDESANLEDFPTSRCSRDACFADIARDGQVWRLLALRSRNRMEWADLVRACAAADIVVADRRLPRGCTPRWLKLDRVTLLSTGGASIQLGQHPRIVTVAEAVRDHPWSQRTDVMAPQPTQPIPPIHSPMGR
nr:ComEC/Rec2 family competence protein [uncultured Sphingomonas sp.]